MRDGILHLSKLIEKYATQNNTSLLIDIQNDKRYTLSSDRLRTIFKLVPQVSLIGDFEQKLTLPANVKTISCANNSLKNNWIVLTRDNYGIFGLVCEQNDDKSYRELFSGDSDLMDTILDLMSIYLKCKIII